MVLRRSFVFLVVIPLLIQISSVGSSKNGVKNKKWNRQHNPNPGNPEFVCKDVHKRQVQGYFSSLNTATSAIRERNIYLYKDITFTAPVLILGWVARGKNGTLQGPLKKRRGIIIEYTAHYMEDDGSFTKIYSTGRKSKQKFFFSEGNLAIPFLRTEVKLSSPVKTTVLRIFPQLWDGVPYIFLEISYCHISDDHGNKKYGELLNTVPGNKRNKMDIINKAKKVNSKLQQKGKDDRDGGSGNKVPDDSTIYKKDVAGTRENKRAEMDDKVPKMHKDESVNKKNKGVKNKPKKLKSNHKTYDLNDTYRGESPTTTGKPRHKVITKNKSKKLKVIHKNQKKVYGKDNKKQNHQMSGKTIKIIRGKKRGRGRLERLKYIAKMRKIMRLRGRMRKYRRKPKINNKLKLKMRKVKNPAVNSKKKTNSHRSGKTNIHQGKNESSVEQDIDGPISKLASRLKNKLTDMAKTELSNKEKPKDLKCGKKSEWRYSGRTPPSDAFSAFRGSNQAWRAIYDLDVKPFQFPSLQKSQNDSNYLQIKFQHPVKIYSVKILGGNDENRWGFITKFVLWYKLTGEKWRYYTDDAGKRRIFYIGEKKVTDVFTPSVFHLPLPIKASYVRIYPKNWNGKPLLSIDFKTCDLVSSKLLNQKFCSIPLLKKNHHGNLIAFEAVKTRRRRLRNKLKTHLIPLSETTTTKITGFIMKSPNTDDESGKQAIVTEIAIQYQTIDGKWKSIIGKGNKLKIFSLDQGAYGNLKPTRFYLQKPVVTKALRIIPENWTGRFPSLYINVFGCSVS